MSTPREENTMAARLPITMRLQAAGPTLVILTPGLKKRVVIQKGRLSHRNATAVVVSLQSVVAANPPAAPVFSVSLTLQDSVAEFDFGEGWALPENAALQATLAGAAPLDVDINVTSHFDADVI
jgi:hypothetical protein